MHSATWKAITDHVALSMSDLCNVSAVTSQNFDACIPKQHHGFLPGLDRLTRDMNEQKPNSQVKISTLFKPGKDAGASPSTPAKRPTSNRITKKAQQAEQAQQAEHTQQAGPAQQPEEEHNVQSQAAAVAGRTFEEGAATADTDAPVARVQSPGNGPLDGQRTLSARATRLQSRLNQQHITELASPGEARVGKRRRASMVIHAPSQMTFCNCQHCSLTMHNLLQGQTASNLCRAQGASCSFELLLSCSAQPSSWCGSTKLKCLNMQAAVMLVKPPSCLFASKACSPTAAA